MKNDKLIPSLMAACALLLSTNIMAANWLMLQGTEPSASAGRAKLWGFVQFQYQLDNSDPNDAEEYIPPKLVGPNLTSQDTFNVNRARIGVRGTGMPIDPKVNYFLLTELGNNAITAADEGGTYITDASITLNHIPGARIRAGLFKAPMAEEGLQAIHVFDYINFTTVGNQLMLERFPNQFDSANAPTLPEAMDLSEGGLNRFDKPVGAFRDVGIQIFDVFKLRGSWEASYAVMAGNGNGLNFTDNDNNKDLYGYMSLEKVFGGAGPRREGLKMFVWHVDGKRLLDKVADGTYNPNFYKRRRWGLGSKYLKKPFRATFEYMYGDGMIFVGPDKPTFDQNGAGPAADGSESEASGWYIEGGYYVGSNWQFDLRYDVYNRLEGDPGPPAGPAADQSFESEWKTVTVGVNYHFNRKTRLTLNIANRDVSSPEWDEDAGPNANMDGIANRYALQLTHIF